MDDITFLGDNIPIEVLRFLPLVQYQLVSPKNVHKVVQYVVLFLSSPEKVLSNQTAPTEMNNEMEAEVKQNLDTLLADKKAKKKLSKSELEHVEQAQHQGPFSVLFTGFYTIFRAALRQHLKQEVFQEQISKMSLPDLVFKSVTGLYEKKREELENRAKQESQDWFEHIVNVRWRVDVTISTSMMTRVFKPVILMQVSMLS
jgi:hypothetical protein